MPILLVVTTPPCGSDAPSNPLRFARALARRDRVLSL